MKILFTSLCPILLAASLSAADSAPSSDATAPTAPADNTAVNKRDRGDKTLTPDDQAKGDDHSDPKDVTVLAAIRRAITKDDAISITGHNVKIIVKGGAATLRGPVKDAAEKARIAEIARKTEGVASVDDQLEIAK